MSPNPDNDALAAWARTHAIPALRYYAQGEQIPDEPGNVNEFGCGCCAGTYDKDGISDYNREVIGRTAKMAMDEFDQLGIKL